MITKILSKLKEDFMKTPRLFQILIVIFLIVSISTASFIIMGCGTVASKEYVYKIEQRAETHFPKYKLLIDLSSKEQLEKLLQIDDKNIQLQEAKDESILLLKQALKLEIDAWLKLIKEQSSIFKKQEQGE